jgi:hypothetical protein
MTTVQCFVTVTPNQFLLGSCTKEEEDFIAELIAVTQARIEEGAIPRDHFDTMDWDAVLAKAKAISVNTHGDIVLDAPVLGVAGEGYFSEANPFASAPKPPKDGLAGQPVNLAPWVVALIVSLGLALYRRDIGKAIGKSAPQAKEFAIKCFETIKDLMLKMAT